MNTKTRMNKASTSARAPSLFAYTPVFSVRLVRERDFVSPPILCPDDAAKLASAYVDGADREIFGAVLLATNSAVIGVTTVSIGTLNAALVSPREVMRVALLACAASIVVFHNHPSGSLEPSREDVAVTKKLVEAGRLMDVRLHDHLILGHAGAYTSLAERGLI